MGFMGLNIVPLGRVSSLSFSLSYKVITKESGVRTVSILFVEISVSI